MQYYIGDPKRDPNLENYAWDMRNFVNGFYKPLCKGCRRGAVHKEFCQGLRFCKRVVCKRVYEECMPGSVGGFYEGSTDRAVISCDARGGSGGKDFFVS